MPSFELVQWLLRTDAYPHATTRVELVETHISWVFLTDPFAYKLKKRLRYDFLDFSTVAARRQACQDEVRLNRRLAPEVYLGVVPVTADADGQLALAGEGEPVDWLVQMRRLPADRRLDELIRQGRLTGEQIEALAATLTRFFAHASPIAISAPEYRQLIEGHVMANRQELAKPAHGLPTGLVRRVHAAQLRYLQSETAGLAERIREGRIIDGHGDLRPEHVYFDPHPLIIDCIEFSPQFRRLDVADELGFLAMECDLLGAPSVGARIVDRYSQTSGDNIPERLANFYKSYRACVRAKVTALRADQESSPQRQRDMDRALQYLNLAAQYGSRLGPPVVLVVCGLAGSGKSTLAEALAARLGAELLQTDAIRRELYGPPTAPSGLDQGRYRPEDRKRVYDELLARARRLLADGLSVVLDGTFLAAASRVQAVTAAEQQGAVALVVRCTCPADVALQRIARRAAAGQGLSEAGPEIYRLQLKQQESDPSGISVVPIDTTEPLESQISAVFARLSQVVRSPAPGQTTRFGGGGSTAVRPFDNEA